MSDHEFDAGLETALLDMIGQKHIDIHLDDLAAHFYGDVPVSNATREEVKRKLKGLKKKVEAGTDCHICLVGQYHFDNKCFRDRQGNPLPIDADQARRCVKFGQGFGPAVGFHIVPTEAEGHDPIYMARLTDIELSAVGKIKKNLDLVIDAVDRGKLAPKLVRDGIKQLRALGQPDKPASLQRILNPPPPPPRLPPPEESFPPELFDD